VTVSGSVALFADTVHNVSDALTAVPLWIAFAVGRRAANRRYTYGYGRAEDLAGLFIVAMIALSAVLAGVQAVRRLLDSAPVEHLGWVALAGLIGFLGNELVAVYRIRVGRSIGSAALVADGLHARTDGLTSLAVLAGAGGVAAGFPLADPLVGLLITVAILAVLRTAVPRRLPAADGRRRPGPRRPRRGRPARHTWSDRRAPRADALDRPRAARRGRPGHRRTGQRLGGAPAGPRRRAPPRPPGAPAAWRGHPRLSRRPTPARRALRGPVRGAESAPAGHGWTCCAAADAARSAPAAAYRAPPDHPAGQSYCNHRLRTCRAGRGRLLPLPAQRNRRAHSAQAAADQSPRGGQGRSSTSCTAALHTAVNGG
jgi:Cation efflux family